MNIKRLHNELKNLYGFLIHTKFLKDFSALSFSNSLTSLLRFLLFIFVAKALGPKTFGQWTIINTILGYIALSHLGVLNAMNREIPFYYGKQQTYFINTIESTSFIFINILCTILVLASLVLFIITHNTIILFSIIFYIAALIYRYFEVYLKSHQKFINLSVLQIASIITLLLGIPLSKYFGLKGWLLANIISYALPILISIIKFKITPTLKLYATSKLFQLIKIGFPIMLVGLTFTVFMTTERWIILHFLGTENLGYYSVVTSTLSFSVLLPNIVADQFFPRMANEMGKTKNYYKIKSLINKQIIISFVLAFVINISIITLFPYFINKWLTEYSLGISALKIIMSFLVLLPIGYSWTSLLSILNKQTESLIIHAMFILLKFGLCILSVKLFGTLESIAYASGISIIIYSVVMTVYGRQSLKKLKND